MFGTKYGDYFIITAMFIAICTVFYIVFFRKILLQNQRIKNAPVQTVRASVISKKTHTSGGTFGGVGNGTGVYGFTDTECFATFQLENGDRMEFCIKPNEYGLLAEGDIGFLTHQYIKFIDFSRIISPDA